MKSLECGLIKCPYSWHTLYSVLKDFRAEYTDFEALASYYAQYLTELCFSRRTSLSGRIRREHHPKALPSNMRCGPEDEGQRERYALLENAPLAGSDQEGICRPQEICQAASCKCH
ncbi:unnamed protein product [Protopolystoma xenopodis]|uniref:Uncharacterized protein n=1 Tax=Protopolystoma xenopodis TaxID=117903 RepID=A0A448WWQ3_9PLAT|nr:unnamed protein product [Protopolystoma xenopodis]